ncbi:uncharacterized protein LOC127714141 [Mytilus californianus]|uniref:uncharacterized protein LOC127714141 n=1 Tax=Mytilus californianus TaxID=6549 RepID=UPI00224554DB|nr:uncharacterized protein LOC127714141 [Mytilus californianus]
MADNITENESRELYHFMCHHIVGTEDHVKQIRLLNAARDNLTYNESIRTITSGSFGEGLQLRGSDIDIMFVQKCSEVYDVKPRFHPSMYYLIMDTNNVKPGFTQLRLEYSSRQTLLDNSVQIADNNYLSSTLWKQQWLPVGEEYTIHGPCIFNKQEVFDIAGCLHCRSWVAPAINWIKRSNNTWPSCDAKQSVIKHGVLFVPIGVKDSSTEDLEWRISFSIARKLLIHTFIDTQLLCYALMKILLKDVIAKNPACKELLCSYFIKTIVFWISEEMPQSAWRPDTFIPCFMQCFSRLIYCVEYSVCLHYFIPENNMFENKIEGLARKILLKTLYELQRYGWRCISLSDQVSKFFKPMQYFNTEQNPLYTWHIHDVGKTPDSSLLHLAYSIFLSKFQILQRFNQGIQHTVSCNKSSIQYLYIHYMSLICSIRAQCTPLNSAYSNDKYRYRHVFVHFYKIYIMTLFLDGLC